MAWQIEEKPLDRPVSLPAKSQCIGHTTVEWKETDPGIAQIICQGGTVDDRWLAECIVREHLAACGIKQARFTFDQTEKTSAWDDIMEKAKRLLQSGNVTLLRNGYNIIVAHTVGDHGEYQQEISRDDPNSRVITQWTCECPWDQFAFQRTRKWKKYEARPCAHVLAAYWKSLGTPLDEQLSEQQAEGMGTGQKLPGGSPLNGPPPGTTFGPPQGQLPFTGVPGPEFSGQMPTPPPMPPPQQQPMMPGMVPNPTTMAPSQLPPLMAPPGENQVIPPFPMNPEQMQMPISVPGGRPGPYPADPLQQPGTFSKVAMAERSGFPDLDAAINEFMQTHDVEHYRDPQNAWGACEESARELAAFLTQRGFRAYAPADELTAFPGYEKAQDSAQIGAGDFSYPEHAMVEVYGLYGPNNVNTVTIDFTASQYGFTEFPKVHPGPSSGPQGTFSHIYKVASGQEFTQGMAARLNEATLGQSEGREGATDAGQWMEIPRNARVEVRDQDRTTGWVEIIYPLKGGPMTSYHVRCFVEPEKLTPLSGQPSPFQNPKR